METKHYREVVKRIRESKVDVIVNLTCGMGGYIVVGDNGLSDTPAPGSDFCSQEDRMRHVIDLCNEGKYRPDIATLDCGSLNFGDGNRAYVSTPNYLRKGCADPARPGREARARSVRYRQPVVRQAADQGGPDSLPCADPVVHGHSVWRAGGYRAICWPWSIRCPPDAIWTSFAISRMQMPWVAQSILCGGNVRVGLEDNLYLEPRRLCEQCAAG